MRTARLDDICEINPRTPKDILDDTPVTFLPMSGVSENGFVSSEEIRSFADVKKGYTYFERGDVLIAKITPCFENGKAALTDGIAYPIGFGSTEFHVVRPSREVDARYVFYLLWNEKFRTLGENGMTGSAGQKRVPADLIRRLEIPLPSLAEQQRIATILDQANQLRQQRRQAIALLGNLTQSIFFEMFGVCRNVRKLTDVSTIRSGSTPSRNDPSNFGGAIPWVKTTEVRGKVIKATEETVTEQGAKIARLKLFEPGTILMAMYGQGTTRGNVAMLGISSTINQACAAILPNSSIDEVFLFYQLRMKYDEIRKLGRGGNQPNLNLDLVGGIDILVPDRMLQKNFREIISNVERTLSYNARSAAIIEDAFSSLQHRAFSGQL